MFSVRNSTLNISGNFKEEKCIFGCNEKETLLHVLNCIENRDKKERNISEDEYSLIHNGKLENQIKLFNIIKLKLKDRERKSTDDKKR